MLRRYFPWITAAVAFSLIIAVVVASCNRSDSEDAGCERGALDATLTHVRVAMKWTWAGTMAPYFAAQKNQRFEHEGLEVELVPGGPGKPSIEQVLFGRADFGITGAHDLALARAKAQPVVSIAVIFKQSPTCLISLTGTGIRVPSDLRGKIVEMTADDNSAFEYRAMLDRNDISFSDVTTRIWDYNYDALLSGQVDATVAYENDQAITLAGDNNISVLALREYSVTPYADVLFTTEDMIKANPALVGQVVSGFLAAWDWAALHPDSTVSIFMKNPEIKPLGLNRNEQVAVLQRSIDFVRGARTSVALGQSIDAIGIQDLARWHETVEILTSYRDLLLGSSDTRWQIPEAQNCFTNRWVELYGMRSKGDQSSKQ